MRVVLIFLFRVFHESAEEANDGPSSRTVARGKLIGAEMAVRIAAGHSIHAGQSSKDCIVM